MEVVAVGLGDERLNKRYGKLVRAHINQTQANAAGPAPPVEVASSFAATQATWRFLNNERGTPQELVKPLRMFAQTQLAATMEAGEPGEGFALLVSDWSKLKYGDHTTKKDVVRLTHQTDIGYELTTHLLVNAQNGTPIAPLEMHLRTSGKVHSTREEPVDDVNHMEQMLQTMNVSQHWNLPLKLVHVIVRDAATQELLSTWYLLTNVGASSASAELIALWYYWRWNIESYFKLMKSAGMELDHWQQESGYAIMNRLLVASMAAVTIWSLQRTTGDDSMEFKDLLVKLSGKTVKRTRPHTCGALLSGLFVLLRIFDFWEQIDCDPGKIAKVQNQLKMFLPFLKE